MAETGSENRGGMQRRWRPPFCSAYPIRQRAKDLPWIGHLFERLESKVSFSGDFSGKAEVLEGEELTAFSQAHDGMTVTVSEVYANEMAVYLTLLLKREEPFPELAQAELDPDYPMVRITCGGIMILWSCQRKTDMKIRRIWKASSLTIVPMRYPAD